MSGSGFNRPGFVPEEFLGQIRSDDHGDDDWTDYTRGTEDEARKWQAADPERRRVVDWIHKERVIFPATRPTAEPTAPDDDALLAGVLRALLDTSYVLTHSGRTRARLTIDGIVSLTPAEHAAIDRIIAQPTVPETGGTDMGHIDAVVSCSACIANGLIGCANLNSAGDPA